MGGLLVKQALVEAGIRSSNYGCIKASTKGLVFFATPHAGGHLAGLADVAANFTSAMTGSATNSLLKTLKQNSLLNAISKDHFRPQLGDYEVLTFIESRKMNVYFRGKLKIIPQVTSMVCLFHSEFRMALVTKRSTLSMPTLQSSVHLAKLLFTLTAIIRKFLNTGDQATTLMSW